MRDVYSYLNEQEGQLNEKLITFGNKAYPKFGNVVILGGGSGSGKGFIIKNLLGIEGMTFDVDALKELSMKSLIINKIVKDRTGIELKNLSLKNPDNTALIHDILSNEISLVSKSDTARYGSILVADNDRKPNLIFDTTLSKPGKLAEIQRNIERLGYSKENIHIVWVINDYKVAIEQNKSRKRTVPELVLMDAHKGASNTMREIIDMGDDIKKYMDGDIWFAFNNIVSMQSSDKGGRFVEDAHLIKVKEQGKSIKNIEDNISKKIAGLVPATKNWE